MRKSYINVLRGITLVKVSFLPDLAFNMSLRLGGKGTVASQPFILETQEDFQDGVTLTLTLSAH